MESLVSSNAVQKLLRAAPFILLAGLVALILRNAWVCDDIYITFRSLYNLLHGEGLVWNSTERVQTFTHPLWLMVLTPIYALLDHAYHSALTASLLFSALALLAVWRTSPSAAARTGIFLLLLGSRAFIDFSTSGLENPLSFFLLVLFLSAWRKPQYSPKDLQKLLFIASLLLLNRLDHLFLLAPPLLLALLHIPRRQFLRTALIGFAPLVLWELFSIVYYGFPFPNTFYAKAMTGLPAATMIGQGLAYLWDSLQSDFLSLPTILLASLAGLRWGTKREKVLLLGIWAYLAYVVWVGGGFMSGRFLASPFFLSVLVLAQIQFPAKLKYGLIFALFACSFLHPYHPGYVHAEYYQDRRGHERELYTNGIVDEKGMSWERSSLLRGWSDSPLKVVEREMDNWGPMPDSILLVETQVAVGLYGYKSGPAVFIVDELALTDPLLARLPALDVPYWRIGHFFRRVPVGYVEGLEKGENGLRDEGLREYYDRLRLVTEGPLFSGARWREILRFNLGLNSHLIDVDQWRRPTEAELNRFPDLVEN